MLSLATVWVLLIPYVPVPPVPEINEVIVVRFAIPVPVICCPTASVLVVTAVTVMVNPEIDAVIALVARELANVPVVADAAKVIVPIGVVVPDLI